MMKVRFSKFEKAAGFFVLGAVCFLCLTILSMGIRHGWFEPTHSYTAIFEAAEGLHPGSGVQVSGLNAGSVDEVELMPDNRVKVKFSILARYSANIREDSRAQLLRPFLIGDRVLEVTVGTPGAPSLAKGGLLGTRETVDLMSLLSGRDLGDSILAMSELVTNVKDLSQAFLKGDRSQNLVTMFGQIQPLLRNMNQMSVEMIKLSRQATRNDNVSKVMVELATTTKELNQLIPLLSQKAPETAANMEKLIHNLLVLTDGRTVEGIDQAVVVLKAMQKSFLLRGNAREVRDEEQKRAPTATTPASDHP